MSAPNQILVSTSLYLPSAQRDKADAPTSNFMHESYNRPVDTILQSVMSSGTGEETPRPFLGIAKSNRPWTDSESRVIVGGAGRIELIVRILHEPNTTNFTSSNS